MPAGSMAIRRSAGKKKNARIWCWCWTATCPATALEAMCFHLDRRGTPDSLAFVQFPQMFHNLSRNDIYTNDLRSLSLPYDSWPIPWERATSPAALGCPIECADGPDLVFSGHFAQKSSNFLKIQPAVHSSLSKYFFE